MEEYIFKDENYTIVGILFEVHKNLGKGFSEIVYKDAIEYEFQQQNILYQREKEFSVNYKDTNLKHKFYADFVVYDKIILEDNELLLKSVSSLIEPVILLILGVVVGFVALSLFVPLFDLTSLTQSGGGGK